MNFNIYVKKLKMSKQCKNVTGASSGDLDLKKRIYCRVNITMAVPRSRRNVRRSFKKFAVRIYSIPYGFIPHCGV